MTHTKKYPFWLAVISNAIIPGLVSFAVIFVLGFILGFAEGFSGVDLYIPTFAVSIVLAASLFFSVKFYARYINTRFVVIDKTLLATVSFILVVLANSLEVFLNIHLLPGNGGYKFGFVLGVLFIKALFLSPFYIASLIYIKNNHVSTSHTKSGSQLPGYVKIVITILIAWCILNIISLVMMPTGFEGYVIPVWYSYVSIGLLAIKSLGVFLLYFQRKLGFFIALVISLTSLVFDYIAAPAHIVLAIFGTMIPVAILYAVLKPSWSKLK